MRTMIVKIGNSRGIRIPKALLEQCNLESSVELEVNDNQLIVRRAEKPREGWNEAFQRMARQGDDIVVDDAADRTDWEAAEWEW